MEQTFSHVHVKQAHHAGLVIGAIAGSCAVTLLVALAITVASPKLLLHPTAITSEVTLQSQKTTPSLGTGASEANELLSNSQNSAGLAARQLPISR